MISLIVNGENHSLNLDPAMPLLWVVRDVLALTGTKFGCGMAQCGACTIHLNGEAIRKKAKQTACLRASRYLGIRK